MNERAPATFGLRFRLEARLQHLQISRELAQSSEEVSSPLPTQRLGALDEPQFLRHWRGGPDYTLL
jgi:hypothetical protein